MIAPDENLADYLLERIAEDDQAPTKIPVGDPARIGWGWIDDDSLRALAASYDEP